MKKRSVFLFLFGALIGLAGVAAQSVDVGKGEVYIGIISFDQTVKDQTGGKPVLLNEGGYKQLIDIIDKQYQKASKTEQGTSLYYAAHNALVNLTANTEMYPSDMDSVSMLTFTDGLDNNSTNPTLKALEGQSFVGKRLSEYQRYLQSELGERKIRDKPIAAYSVGVKGMDVSDNAAFTTSIESVASSKGNAFFLDNFDKLGEVFNGIADDLYKQTRDITFNVQAPVYPVGTKLRMTFDVPYSNISPSAAAASRNYLEGEISYTNGQYELINVTYSGNISSTSGNSVKGVLDRLLTYGFAGFQGLNLDYPDVIPIQQWSMGEGSDIWQVNSEYTIDLSAAMSVETKSTVIYLVLDSSNSLKDADVESIRAAVKDFLNIMYTGETPALPAPQTIPARSSPSTATAPATPPATAPATPPATAPATPPATPPATTTPTKEIRYEYNYDYFTGGERFLAMSTNWVFGIGSLLILEDIGGGLAIGVTEFVGLLSLSIGGALYDDYDYVDEYYETDNTGSITLIALGATAVGISFIMGAIFPWTYTPEVRVASTNPLDGFGMSFGANRKGNIDKVSLTYKFRF